MNPRDLTYWNAPYPRDREHAAQIREALREAEQQASQQSLDDYIAEQVKKDKQTAPPPVVRNAKGEYAYSFKLGDWSFDPATCSFFSATPAP